MSFFCIGLVRGYSAPAVPSISELKPQLLPTKSIASWASKSTPFDIAYSSNWIGFVFNWAQTCGEWMRLKKLCWEFAAETKSIFDFPKGSIPPLGALFGSLLAAPLLHYFGRKFVIILASPMWALGWISIAISQHWQMVMLGRLLSGFCVGLSLPAAQIYVSFTQQRNELTECLPSLYRLAGQRMLQPENSRSTGLSAIDIHVLWNSGVVRPGQFGCLGHLGLV